MSGYKEQAGKVVLQSAGVWGVEDRNRQLAHMESQILQRFYFFASGSIDFASL